MKSPDLGNIFSRELAIAPRRPAHYIYRTAYPLVLLVLMWTAWLVMVGTQNVRNVGDIAFGSMLFQILAPLQIALLSFRPPNPRSAASPRKRQADNALLS